MTTPRYKLIDPENACAYHLASRCVRRSWLCGRDPLTGKDWSHRRQWLVDRMHLLARCFAVEIHAYAIMSNHFHLVAYHDPKASEAWSDAEVARRWIDAFPPTKDGRVAEELKEERRELMQGDKARLARARRTLGSLSGFMKHLKQPIARRANVEDDCEGHFFEQRFYSGALLSENALVAAMAYVDLNPVRAGLAARIEECRDTSGGVRVRENSAEALAEYLRPVASGLEDSEPAPRTGFTLASYLELIADMAAALTAAASRRAPDAPINAPDDRVARWLARTASLRDRQRAYGPLEQLRAWTKNRGLRLRETPLPD